MALELIEPKIRGFICTSAHPAGCAANVASQIAVAKTYGPGSGLRSALILGSSTGYGLGCRVSCAFGYGAGTIGVALEKGASGKRTGSAGWYNTAAFHDAARAAGLAAHTIVGDAFGDEVKEQTVRAIKDNFGTVDCVIYSLASPRRTNPRTGVTHNSCLKPIGPAYSSKTVNLNTDTVEQVNIEPASEKDIADTVAVMGGEDWRWWMERLLEEGALAPGCRTVAFSYIGPKLTFPIYRNGTIGRAKEDLERTAGDLDGLLQSRVGGRAWVAVLKAVVTQAASAIPVVPLYVSILFRVMKDMGLHEGPIEQTARMMRDHFHPGVSPKVDDRGLIRLDDLEMRPDVQAEVQRRWDAIDTARLHELSDYAGFRADFRRLFGFEVDGVDYARPVEVEVPIG